MARTRKEVVREVQNQIAPLFEHLIPLVALKQKNLSFPTNWPGEIRTCMLRIHAKNGSKGSRKKWLEADDIERFLNEGLISNLRLSVIEKLTSEKGKSKPFPENTIEIVKKYLDVLFDSTATLRKMGVSIKYEDAPMLYIGNEKI
jgi:hypothetical protein